MYNEDYFLLVKGFDKCIEDLNLFWKTMDSEVNNLVDSSWHSKESQLFKEKVVESHKKFDLIISRVTSIKENGVKGNDFLKNNSFGGNI